MQGAAALMFAAIKPVQLVSEGFAATHALAQLKSLRPSQNETRPLENASRVGERVFWPS